MEIVNRDILMVVLLMLSSASLIIAISAETRAGLFTSVALGVLFCVGSFYLVSLR